MTLPHSVLRDAAFVFTQESKSITFYSYIQQTLGQLEQALHCYLIYLFILFFCCLLLVNVTSCKNAGFHVFFFL